MKIYMNKILMIVLILILFNIPFIFLISQKNLSEEQPNANLVFDEMIHLSDKTKKQEIGIRENNLSGFSVVTFSGKFFNKAQLKLKIKEADHPEKVIREKTYEMNLGYLYEIQRFTFEPVENSAGKKFIIEIFNINKGDYSVANDENNKKGLSLRPLYFTDKIVDNVYYRISQYKPFLLKGFAFFLIYTIFNILLGFFIFKLLKNEKTF